MASSLTHISEIILSPKQKQERANMSNSAPTIGTVAKAEHGRSGKTVRVQIDGKWYSTKHFEFLQMVGQTISFVPDTSFYNGKTYLWINEYNIGADGPPPQQAPQPAQQTAPQAASAPRQATNVENRDCLPMTSNLVAHAIQAGLVKAPEDIHGWANAAFNAAYRLLSARHDDEGPDEFDDDIPF